MSFRRPIFPKILPEGSCIRCSRTRPLYKLPHGEKVCLQCFDEVWDEVERINS